MLNFSVFIMYFVCVLLAVLSVSVVGPKAPKAPKAKKTEDALKEIEATLAQELFQNSKTCSSSFATGIAVAADIFAKIPSAESFDAVLQETLNRGQDFIREHYESLPEGMFRSFSKPDLPSDVDSCFPFPSISPRTTFYSMTRNDATLIAAAVRWTLVGRSPQPEDQANYLADIAEAIVKTLSNDQLNVVYGMEYVTDFKNSLTDEVCTNRYENDPRISPALRKFSVPLSLFETSRPVLRRFRKL